MSHIRNPEKKDLAYRDYFRYFHQLKECSSDMLRLLPTRDTLFIAMYVIVRAMKRNNLPFKLRHITEELDRDFSRKVVSLSIEKLCNMGIIVISPDFKQKYYMLNMSHNRLRKDLDQFIIYEDLMNIDEEQRMQ